MGLVTALNVFKIRKGVLLSLLIKRQNCHIQKQSTDLLLKSVDWFLYDGNFGV